MSGMGRYLIMTGIILIAAGLIVMFFPRIPWLGKLPGDIFVKRENFSFYFPLASCLLVSALLSFIFWLFRK